MTTAENMSLPLHEDTSSVGATPIILKHNFMIYECHTMKRSKFLLRIYGNEYDKHLSFIRYEFDTSKNLEEAFSCFSKVNKPFDALFPNMDSNKIYGIEKDAEGNHILMKYEIRECGVWPNYFKVLNDEQESDKSDE